MMFEFFKRSAHKYYGESPNFHDKDHSRVILITIADKGEADRNAGTYSTGDKRLSNFGKRVAGFVTKQKYSFKTVGAKYQSLFGGIWTDVAKKTETNSLKLE